MFALVIVVVAATVLVGTTLGGRFSVAPPVLLLVFGALLGLAPGLTEIGLDPDIVLLLFLPGDPPLGEPDHQPAGDPRKPARHHPVQHASGVVAVVTAGLVLAYAGPRIVRARSRLQAYAFWELSTFLLNGGLFVLVGLQLPQAVRDLDSVGVARAVVVALIVTAVVVGSRLVWVNAAAWVIRAIDRRPAQRLRRVGWRQRTAGGWVGFRGAVSLAAALAVPASIGGGEPFPDRDLIIFTTSVVILLTILVQGTTLPAVVRWARLPADTARVEELQFARTAAVVSGCDQPVYLAGHSSGAVCAMGAVAGGLPVARLVLYEPRGRWTGPTRGCSSWQASNG